MRKSHVLATAIVVVVILVLVLARMLARKPADESAREQIGLVLPDDRATSSEQGAGLSVSQPSSRSDLGENRDQAAPQPMAGKSTLLVRVRYASGLEENHDGLEVGISNLAGDLFKLRHLGPNEFEFADAVPGAYIIAAKTWGFRTAVARCRISAESAITNVTVTLVPERKVQVRWRTDDGRAIRTSVADVEQHRESVLLEVGATKFRAAEARPLDRYALGWLRSEIVFDESETGGRVAREKQIEWTRPEPIERASSDHFGTLILDEDGPFWVNAYCRRVCVASLLVSPGATEVEIVTPLADLAWRGATVKMIVVDDATGGPIEGASLRIDGCDTASLSKVDGSLLTELVPPGRRVGVLRAEEHAETIFGFTARIDETTDLGTVRMADVAPEAHFRIVDSAGSPVGGVQVELVDLDSGRASPLPILSTYTARSGDSFREDSGANISFSGLQRAPYGLRCIGGTVDVSPRVINAAELSSPSNPRVIAELIARPAHRVSFVLDPPIAKGTQAVIETQSGLPVRELDVDEFGVANSVLLPGSYKLHLIEYGRATSAVDVHVDTNPFVFEIHR